jgi:hypothetical protein
MIPLSLSLGLYVVIFITPCAHCNPHSDSILECSRILSALCMLSGYGGFSFGGMMAMNRKSKAIESEVNEMFYGVRTLLLHCCYTLVTLLLLKIQSNRKWAQPDVLWGQGFDMRTRRIRAHKHTQIHTHHTHMEMTHTHTHIHIYTHTYKHKYSHTQTYTHAHIHTYLQVVPFKMHQCIITGSPWWMSVRVLVCVYVCVCACACACVCVCVFVSVSVWARCLSYPSQFEMYLRGHVGMSSWID